MLSGLVYQAGNRFSVLFSWNFVSFETLRIGPQPKLLLKISYRFIFDLLHCSWQ